MSSTANEPVPSEQVESKQIEHATFLLRKLLVSHPEFAEQHTWAYEYDRWAELIYALLSRVVNEETTDVRTVVLKLNALHLLDISSMSEPQREQRFVLVLKEEGFTSEEALQAWSIVREAAAAVQNNLGGRIHFFLRDHAELMLRQLSENIKFSTLDDVQAEQAFSLWLQNSCNLPLSLFDQYVLEFCERSNISLAALVTAADNLNLNLALVDDLIRLDFENSETSDDNG